jgi:hypothetical protein
LPDSFLGGGSAPGLIRAMLGAQDIANPAQMAAAIIVLIVFMFK